MHPLDFLRAPQAQDYLISRMYCVYDFKDVPAFKDPRSRGSLELFAHLAAQMTTLGGHRALNQRDPADMINMALRCASLVRQVANATHLSPSLARYVSGFGVPEKSNEGALWALDALLDASCGPERYIGSTAPRTLLAQAHSCAAEAHYRKAALKTASARATNAAHEQRFARPATLRAGSDPRSPLDYFLLALEHANASAALGLASYAALMVGGELVHIAEIACGLDVEPIARRGKHFRPLWRALVRNWVFWEEVAIGRPRKLKGADSSRADVFVCAAEGCGRRGGKRGPFRECAGPCDPFWKPHYCSRQCQKKVLLPPFLARVVLCVRLMILLC